MSKPLKILCASPNFGKATQQATQIASQILIQAKQLGITDIHVILYPSDEIAALKTELSELKSKLGIKNPNIRIDEFGPY